MGNLTVNNLITVKGEISGVEPITKLIEETEVIYGDLELDELIILESYNFNLTVNGCTTTFTTTNLDKLHI
tara:strand:+ start:103 stop:315 length:213 start_codon:yes stop_codon:yes gene_type:complete